MAVKAAKDTWAVGCQVELATTLTDEETVKGEVFAYDDKTKTLVLREPYGGSKGNTHLGEKEGYNIRMLNTNYVTKIVSAEPAKQPQAQVLPYVCTKRAEEREAKALMGANKRAEQIGVGVTRAAQSVFDSVNKTLPCRWQGKDIIVIGEVTIVSPYGLDNCTVVPGAEKTLDQVKKVLSS
mmetsp:Transcript_8196/g.28153  ORF Transcript_8196/g.28153 Transcript_8196/m.28153 type:complete len:181 (-) Transcript_8196:51-593(-)